MICTEQLEAIPCAGEELVGVLTLPEEPAHIGVVVIVGGPQYRVGSHRQFVLLARHLAEQGIPTLRFDCRGMGDSSGDQRSFDVINDDVRSAIDALMAAVPSLSEVALWGLCDGASAALLYVGERGDPRITALCLVNPWVRSAESLARTHIEHHYWRRLHEPAFWARLLTGQVGFRALASLWTNLKLGFGSRATGSIDPQRPFQQRMAQAWRGFRGRILLLLSENDYTANEFRGALASDPIWANAGSRAGLERRDLGGADHTLSARASREAVERFTSDWLLSQSASAAARGVYPAQHVLDPPR